MAIEVLTSWLVTYLLHNWHEQKRIFTPLYFIQDFKSFLHFLQKHIRNTKKTLQNLNKSIQKLKTYYLFRMALNKSVFMTKKFLCAWRYTQTEIIWNLFKWKMKTTAGSTADQCQKPLHLYQLTSNSESLAKSPFVFWSRISMQLLITEDIHMPDSKPADSTVWLYPQQPLLLSRLVSS